MDKRISNLQQIASIRKYVFTDGKEKDLEVIDCDNGKIRFLINVSKACDIMQLYHEGTNVSFISKNGFTKREVPFINRFEGGMMYTCGLESIGAREGCDLHGSFHNIPAQIARSECNEQGIIVEGKIAYTALFGQNLVIYRKIYSALGSNSVSIEDTLVNEGFKDEQYCALYHVNVGYPMLDDGAKIEADVVSCVPRTAWAKEIQSSLLDVIMPENDMEEVCYFLKMKKPEISVSNAKLGKKLTVKYSDDTLTNFIMWKSMASGDYALGLEPATADLDDGFCYKIIKPQQKIKHFVEISVE